MQRRNKDKCDSSSDPGEKSIRQRGRIINAQLFFICADAVIYTDLGFPASSGERFQLKVHTFIFISQSFLKTSNQKYGKV